MASRIKAIGALPRQHRQERRWIDNALERKAPRRPRCRV